jgi:hypothetical protein
MPRSDKPEHDVLDLPAAEPIVLVGAPGELHGEVRLHNPGEQKLVLRDARVRSEALKIARVGAPTAPAELALRRIVLRGGQSRSLPFQVPMSPHTPPGEYRGQIEVGGRTREVVMHVTEVVRLEISPDPLVVRNSPGETITKRAVFTNSGNVALTIGDIGAVALDDVLRECRTNRAAIAAIGDKVGKLDEYIAELARQTKVALEQSGNLRVHLSEGELTLEPGEVRPVELSVRIPDSLDRRARYVGVAAIYNANLTFDVVPTHAAPGKRPAKKTS